MCAESRGQQRRGVDYLGGVLRFVAMLSSTTIQLLAARAASILVSWAGLSPARKHDNGDRSSNGGFAMILGILADRSQPPPSDAEQRVTEYLVKFLSDKCSSNRSGYLYVSMCVDYGPDKELADLGRACGLNVSWPNKSRLSIDAGEGNPGSVTDSQGYGSRGVYYQLVPELGGTLVTEGFSVASPVRTIVAQAVIAGNTIGGVGSWEPFPPAPPLCFGERLPPPLPESGDDDDDDDFESTKDEVELYDSTGADDLGVDADYYPPYLARK